MDFCAFPFSTSFAASISGNSDHCGVLKS
jgi:hypothetical protein